VISDRRHLLERCLRLESEIVRLKQAGYRRLHPYATEEDRARIRDLRRRGMTARAIAQQTGWSVSMVYATTKGIEQEAK